MLADSLFIPCTTKIIPEEQAVEAAERAIQINPANRPRVEGLSLDGSVLQPQHLAVLTSRYWGANGVKLTVGFLDNAPKDLQERILKHMNAWGAFCNVKFVLSHISPQVRITRVEDGYWSNLGTDVLSIPQGRPTMNLQGFTMNTPESEFIRVVRHETGHTLGYPHEHMRQELVARLDVNKTVSYFQRTQGWSASTTRQQVLTPLSEASIRVPGIANTAPDQDSIMCYQLPGSITVDGLPIKGGVDIDQTDREYAAKLYPLPVTSSVIVPNVVGMDLPTAKSTVMAAGLVPVTNGDAAAKVESQRPIAGAEAQKVSVVELVMAAVQPKPGPTSSLKEWVDKIFKAIEDAETNVWIRGIIQLIHGLIIREMHDQFADGTHEVAMSQASDAVQAMIDGLIDKLIADNQGKIFVVVALKVVKRKIDLWIQSNL